MTSTANAERVARHRAKRDIERLGRMNGWTLIPDATLFTASNGTTVAVGIDGARLPLTLDPNFDTVGEEASNLSLSKHKKTRKKVWAPKNWKPTAWNTVRQAVIEQQLTRESTVDQLGQYLELGKLTEDQVRKAVAVIEALPDTPDWYLSLPEAEEK